MSFLMVFGLIDSAIVVLWLLIFKGCRIIEISKIEVFNFSGNERVEQNQTNEKLFKTFYLCNSIAFQVVSAKAE